MNLPPLFDQLPADLAPSYSPERPWDLLGSPLDKLLAELPDEHIEGLIEPGVHISGNNIVIGKGSRVRSGAFLQGPLRIGEDCEIRPGAFLRGGVWLEDGCVVGANTEVKHAIFLAGAAAPHLNYVGDSILGARVNLGAGTVLSNFRHDGGEIAIGSGGIGDSAHSAIPTGRRKLGAILGDRVLTGCNCVLHPGCLVGAGTQLYPGVQLRSGVHPANRIIKLRQELEIVERRES